ncbi:hypothetical protein [Bacillus solitudinis]|uniref:hypothetical protein n=1 Tax=Bacillus solitudinis TaxID=2014074 RepID=UPI000C237271|nr:hypothetical protein [Bacillus solitudinis]
MKLVRVLWIVTVPIFFLIKNVAGISIGFSFIKEQNVILVPASLFIDSVLRKIPNPFGSFGWRSMSDASS